MRRLYHSDKNKNKAAVNPDEADKGLDWDWLYYIGTVPCRGQRRFIGVR